MKRLSSSLVLFLLVLVVLPVAPSAAGAADAVPATPTPRAAATPASKTKTAVRKTRSAKSSRTRTRTKATTPTRSAKGASAATSVTTSVRNIAKSRTSAASGKNAKQGKAAKAAGTPAASGGAAPSKAAVSPKDAAAAAADSRAALVKATKALLRAKPEKAAQTLATLVPFTRVEVLGTSGSWTKVRVANGTTGYLAPGALARGAFVSTQGGPARVRSGPTAKATAMFSLKDHYPLRVLENDGSWARVKDYEGDGGWVSVKSLSLKSYVIVKKRTVTVREGPGTQTAKRFVADKGFPFEVIEEKSGWLHVKCADGDEGWCNARDVWGWVPE